MHRIKTAGGALPLVALFALVAGAGAHSARADKIALWNFNDAGVTGRASASK